MPPAAVGSLFPEALDANRRGLLSDQQRRGFGHLSRSRHRSGLSSAALLLGGAVLVGVFAPPTASPVVRVSFTLGCLAVSAFFVVRAVTGIDALTRDVREGRVKSVEGAIGKRQPATGGSSPASDLYLLDVGDDTFNVGRDTYRDAPDAGYVRLYFLPRSRKLVNLERLPNPPLPEPLTPFGLLQTLGEAIGSPHRRDANDAHAVLASVTDAINASVVDAPATPPASAGNPRPLEQALVGTWTNGVVTVTFSADGTVTMNTFGIDRRGRWSVNAGRLTSDVTGQAGTVDAWVAGHTLTIAMDGTGYTLTRQADD
jgi:hypothetical protein